VKARIYAYGPLRVGLNVESAKKFIGVERYGSPEGAIAGHAREEYPHAASTGPHKVRGVRGVAERARSQRVLPELTLETERDPLAYEHGHHGLGV
jgi:hypothetical protein